MIFALLIDSLNSWRRLASTMQQILIVRSRRGEFTIERWITYSGSTLQEQITWQMDVPVGIYRFALCNLQMEATMLLQLCSSAASC